VPVTDLVVIVTGAGSGLGRATAIRFAADGGHLVLGDLNQDGGRDTERRIRSTGGDASFVQTDVRDPTEVQNLMRIATERHGRVDVLVSAAGAAPFGAVQDLSDADWHLAIDTSLTGAFHCCRAVLPVMRRGGYGAIVLVASMVTRSVPGNYAAHVAAKSGLLGLTRAMANGLREENVSVMAICPGFINTPMGWQGFREIFGREPTPNETERMLQPESLADMIVQMVDPRFGLASGTIVEVPSHRL
jgi:3-oxoacyl-[acyl-carrier protein] reductase